MLKWDLFAYLSAFVTIVLAIALTDIIQSAHRLLRARRRVRWDVLTPLLAVWVFLWVLSEFFSLWLDARYERINYFGLLSLMAVPTVAAFTAYAVLPDEIPQKGLDLEQFYFENRRYLIVLLALYNVADILRIVVYAFRYDGMNEFAPWIGYLIVWTAFFAGLALLYFVRARWAQLTGIFLLYARLAVHLSAGDWEIKVMAGA
jgi:hypothetical protein